MKRDFKFRAWIPELSIMLNEICVYNSGDIGMNSDEFGEYLRAKNPDFAVDYDEMTVCEYDHDFSSEKVMNLLRSDEWVQIEADKVHIMQYIGRKDKKDNPIFEGDILRLELVDSKEIEFFLMVYLPDLAIFWPMSSVEYNDYLKNGSAPDNMFAWGIAMEKAHIYEVCGNRWEHPHKFQYGDLLVEKGLLEADNRKMYKL